MNTEHRKILGMGVYAYVEVRLGIHQDAYVGYVHGLVCFLHVVLPS